MSLVDAELVGLDREQRLVELSDGATLAYDVLLVTAGLQEQVRAWRREEGAFQCSETGRAAAQRAGQEQECRGVGKEGGKEVIADMGSGWWSSATGRRSLMTSF